MEAVQIIALTMGIAWASGINLYAAIATLGILGATGNMVVPPGLEVVQHPAVIAAAGLMYCVEFFADKIPGVDTGWDTIHTFVRIPAAGVLSGRPSMPRQNRLRGSKRRQQNRPGGSRPSGRAAP